MNVEAPDLIAVFREAMTDCKRLYTQAARVSLQDQPSADDATRHDMIRRMVDLHQGLLIKIFTSVARADSRLSRTERELAAELIDHLWQQKLDEQQFKEVVQRIFRDAGHLQWYSLLRPFDRIAKIRNFVPELQTIVMRIANLVAKADGTVSAEETAMLQSIQRELEVHLCRIQLEDSDRADPRTGSAEAIQIQHQEPTRLKTATPSHDTTSIAKSDSSVDLARADTVEEALADLQQLIGLDGVKQEIATLTNYLTLQQHRQAAGLPQHQLSLHMVFQGNPGTGKTTTARIVGRIYRSLGLLKRGHLIETDRAGLVAEYAGQTAPKANRKIDEALDGILFIDEAYSLVASGQDDAYGHEAVQTLVKRLEDERHRLVVILAGYPGPIRELLHSNPGLSSRFNTQLMFDDYGPLDLARIYQRMCEANHYELPALVRAKLLLGFHRLYLQRDEHFGNGRLVRNTFEGAVRRLANRVAGVASVTRELLTVFTPDDVVFPELSEDLSALLQEGNLRFRISCTECQESFLLRADQLGHRVRCPRCEASQQADWGLPPENAPLQAG